MCRPIASSNAPAGAAARRRAILTQPPGPSAPYHSDITFGGAVYPLRHLDPITFSTPSRKLGRSILTWCRFTTHCFTRQPEEADQAPFLLDEGRRPRVFCPERYSLSAFLPGAMRQLEDAERYVSETAAERNWMHCAEVEITAGALLVRYQVFFALKKARRAEVHDVELTVESAYAFDPLRVPKLRGRMKIAGVLTATVEGRKVHTHGR